MKTLRVIDQAGNKHDYDAEFVPRIGERILLTFGVGTDPVRPHYFRVKDVQYALDNPVDHQVSILIEDDRNSQHWPS